MVLLKRILTTLTAAIVLMISGCGGGNSIGSTDPVIIELRKGVMAEPVGLSEIAQDIRLIRLETSDKSLIRNFNGYVGERHIISVGQAVIHLFSSDGAFIGEVSRRGKGPGEFTQVDAWAVDGDEKYFLYHEMGKNHINRYDLERLSQAEPIPFQSKGSLNSITVYDDSLLLIMPGIFGSYGYDFFFQTFDGTITGGMERKDVPHPGAWAGMNARLHISAEGKILMQPSESDTVYIVEANALIPAIYCISERPEKFGDMTKGAYNIYLYERNGLIHFLQTGYEKTISQGNAMISINDVRYFIYDRKKSEVRIAEPLYHELWGYRLDLPGLVFQDGGLIHCSVQAMEIRRFIRDALASSGSDAGNSSGRKELETLYALIKEDDNPVIIRGRLK